MNTAVKNNFQLPRLGSFLSALNLRLNRENRGASSVFGKRMIAGSALVSGHWTSLSDVQGHCAIKFVHNIRIFREGMSIRLSMMFFKPSKVSLKTQHINMGNAFMHTLLIEHSSTGAIEKISFGVEKGQQHAQKIATIQTLEGNAARQYMVKLCHGWVRGFLAPEDLALIEHHTHDAIKSAFGMQTLLECTAVLVDRAASMHQRMMKSYDNPAASRTVDQALLYVYEKGVTPVQSSLIFDVAVDDVLQRKEFYDRVSRMLGTSSSELVVKHLVTYEHLE